MEKFSRLPTLLIALPCSAGALLMAWIATMVRQQRGEFPPPAWMGIAMGAVIVWELLAILCLVYISRRRNDPLALYTVALAGFGILMMPVCVALFLSFAGLPLSHLYAAAAFSAVTTLVWPLVVRLRPA